MASLDINSGYSDVKRKIESSKSYNDLKSQYDGVRRRAGDSFEKKKESVTKSLNSIKSEVGQEVDKIKRFKNKVKNQFEELLDINSVLGQNTNYVKRTLIETIRNVEPRIKEIVLKEAIKAIGCEQQQTYTPQSVYIKVKSVDILNILTKNPSEDPGKLLYEQNPNTNVGQFPYSMNRELFQRIQTNNPYSVDYGQLYRGKSGQELFDIQYVETDNNGVTGPWYKVDLVNRVGINSVSGINKVGSFLSDYYGTIKVTETTNIMASIMESMTNVISISADVGVSEVRDKTQFGLLLQRILGLCFDNREEIDVSGISKISELDGVDDSFFEFDEIDLRIIENRINNVKEGVIEFEECDNVKVPIDTDAILQNLNNLNFVEGNDLVNLADQLTETLINNEKWIGLNVDVQATVNLNFIKLIAEGMIGAILTPKTLLPIFIMRRALQNGGGNSNNATEFLKNNVKFSIEMISQVGAIFVEELFKIIKRDIQLLVQQILGDIAREMTNKKLAMIIRLIQLILIVASFIKDWRRCRSVVDEILALLNLITSGSLFGGAIPLPLLFASQLLSGYSDTRAFTGTIEELQRLGIPTGALPDGSPNMEMLSKFAQIKGMSKEDSENNKVQIAIGPLTMTPAGLTIPTSAFGKKM
jgi:hypothetical protein